ncbi:MAG: hypothetical protein AVDCRST_MAG40-53 [uncultured Gemmatimonadaceae bacterium]|uniref:Uncharacterized protein n=1 Tax=uncultured Gemmatimonadaceae bacterium TaxID=246130 RepID=A0A6J4K5V3_9BACT|nr:MAG: hypothetical protein AVDCRST_MAG40-53 [uncultured Gemmatimonadaceae bacterium]
MPGDLVLAGEAHAFLALCVMEEAVERAHPARVAAAHDLARDVR